MRAYQSPPPSQQWKEIAAKGHSHSANADAQSRGYAYMGSDVDNANVFNEFAAYGLNEITGQFYQLSRSESNRTRFLKRACVHDAEWTCFYDMVGGLLCFVSVCLLVFLARDFLLPLYSSSLLSCPNL